MFLVLQINNHFGRVKQNAQIQIILRMRKVSFAPLLSIHFLLYPIILFVDSESPDQTARTRMLIWALRCPHMLEDTFSHGAA